MKTFRIFVSSVQDEFAEEKSTGNHQKDCPINCPLNGPLKLLEAIRKNPGLRKTRLAEICDLTVRTVKFYIENELASKIEYRGSKKTGGYYAVGPREGGAVLMDSEAINESINEVIKEAIKSAPGINRPRLAKMVGKGKTMVERTLAELIRTGKVEHRGSKKTGGYYLVDAKPGRDGVPPPSAAGGGTPALPRGSAIASVERGGA